MQQNSRERVLNLLSGQVIDRLPLMPITMQLAAKHINQNYCDYATNYKVLVDGQLRIAEKFCFDHVSCISDPTREASDCGAKIIYEENSPPATDESNALLLDKTKLKSLLIPDPLGGGRMYDRILAAELFKEKIGGEKVIEGWVEGPCAEAADLRGLATLMMDFYEDPVFVRDLFEFTTELGLRFAKYQIEAGVDIVGVGDAACSLIGPDLYNEFVWPYEKRLIDGIHKMGGAVRLHICGNTTSILEGMGKLKCEIVDLDYLTPISEGREKMGPNQVILGNIDPVEILQDSNPENIFMEIKKCHQQAGDRYIVGAGCEITRDTPVLNIYVLRDYAVLH